MAIKVDPTANVRAKTIAGLNTRLGLRAHEHNQTSSHNQGRRIGILIVAYNAVKTLATVLRRIPADVWANVEEVVVFELA